MVSIILHAILIVAVFTGCSVIYETVTGKKANLLENKRTIVLLLLFYSIGCLVSVEFGFVTTLSLIVMYMIYLFVR